MDKTNDTSEEKEFFDEFFGVSDIGNEDIISWNSSEDEPLQGSTEVASNGSANFDLTEEIDLFSTDNTENDFEELDLFSEYNSKSLTKKKIPLTVLLVLVVIVASIGVVIFGKKFQSDREKVKSEIENVTSSNSGVMYWLNCFMEGQYDMCDDLVEDGDKLVADYKVEDGLGVLVTKSYDALVNCIKEVKVSEINQSVDGTEYVLKVTYTPYKTIDELDVPEKKLEEIKLDYLDGVISDSEFESELTDLYIASFDNCLVLDKDETKTVMVCLSEVAKDEVTVSVRDIDKFVLTLLEDSNIANNISLYEDKIGEVIGSLLKTD